ncbi:MAG: DUF808 domain-containing protein [Haemophilus parainfluenzae]|jgi:conserved inner membrane protein|uniref:DUF808 domain-containing protein n=1 Tax=uncultured Haemophilus sp. TaxID=237779 RepID=UPI0028062938|nr:DUF808 domain-containing protein [uncultured Haemophilus sp.]MDU4460722.1 DUF808 domain-containing protein [Haemophilus parainfluenzae]MDU4566523.1 DUF808 domain-containing protein [Haemophilus parainfluenzae]MDU4638428.1 DUF808 domain-containing protein [Haemophilus parainfluenzae]MDU5010006.1 DUF808 domain-containing protein [Haemophilus parainfluenzae]MDU5991137.1 DUF808 domain-containing protein [Haemophilus parainfluenzae]
MAFSSLFTLIDDIASILDDVALMTKMAAKKTVGVVGDDLALNANQVTGASSDRELPIVWAVTKGSLVNKVILIPIALLLSAFLPWLIVPLLMIGGAYLCFEGVEKILHKFIAHEEHEEKKTFNEAAKIKGAIRTDFILSAEIIIIALGELTEASLLTRIISLSVVGIGITIFVYGLVALIVRADDFGLYLIKKGGVAKSIGNAILVIMPKFMRSLSFIGTLAMFLVGGGIFVHNVDFIHHLLADYQLADGLLGNVATLVVGVIVGAIACAIVLPAMKLFGKH